MLVVVVALWLRPDGFQILETHHFPGLLMILTLG